MQPGSISILASALAVPALFGCSSKSEAPVVVTPDAGRPVCDEIGHRCHDFESIPLGKECHINAHTTWTEAECVAKKASCFAACTETDAGGADSGGATDAAPTDAAPTDAAAGG